MKLRINSLEMQWKLFHERRSSLKIQFQPYKEINKELLKISSLRRISISDISRSEYLFDKFEIFLTKNKYLQEI